MGLQKLDACIQYFHCVGASGEGSDDCSYVSSEHYARVRNAASNALASFVVAAPFLSTCPTAFCDAWPFEEALTVPSTSVA